MADMKSEKEQLNELENLFRQKRFSDALEVAKKASSDYPSSYPIKFLFVRTLKELNKLAEAGEVLKELMLIYPNNINLLLESGNLAVLQDKFDEGIEYYNKILFLDPFNTEAKNSIEEINIIKKDGRVKKVKGGGVSSQNQKLQSADTLPEFDSGKLRDIISEEPLPPPPPPPPAPELLPSPPPSPVPENKKEEPIKEQEPELLTFSSPTAPEMSEISEVDTDETGAETLFQQKLQEEVDETEMPPSISNMEETDSSPGMEAEKPENSPTPEYEIPPIPDVEKELEKIREYSQKEHREPQTGEPAQALSIPESEPREKIQEKEPGLTAAPPPKPDVTDVPDIPDIPDIPESPIEMEQVMERYEPEVKMEEAEAPRQAQEVPGTQETGFVTESAAELYVEQGLLDDAVAIYKKLYDSRKEERFLSKIEELKRVILNQKKIQVLNELLKHIRQKGEEIV